jgi:hypothetical protein
VKKKFIGRKACNHQSLAKDYVRIMAYSRKNKPDGMGTEKRCPGFRLSWIGLFCALFWATCAPLPAPAQVNVLTYHNDNARTGQDLNETTLTPANVNTNTFGLLFSYPVDGQVFAQPLYMAAVAITNQGTHNVVIAATENDSVFAFDADTHSPPLWQVSFINPAAGVTAVPSADVDCTVISPVVGITGTPVIDPTTLTLYVVAKTKEVNGTTTNYVHRLHALDMGSGAEKFGGPVVIQPVVAGTGEVNDGAGHVLFNDLRLLNRPALLLANGVVYAAFASHCDYTPYHGWILGFNAQTLQPQGVFNSTPNGGLGGFWEGADGPATDAEGYIYVICGNGTFDGTTNNDFGDSYLKLAPDGTNLVVADYFTPYNQLYLSTNDMDAGSGGLVVLPDAVGSAAHPHLAVGAGKDGIIHLVDRDALGEYNPTNNDQIVQSLAAIGACYSVPAYFDNTLYYIANKDAPKAFAFSDGLLETNPISTNSTIFVSGATPSITADGTTNAIVWALQNNSVAILHAYNATNLALELYNSQQAGSRDALGTWVHFTVPTVANGKVYAGTASALSVFGIALWNATPGIVPDGGIFTNSVMVTFTSNAPASQIYYTLDGTTPTTNSAPYSAPLSLTNTTIVQAIAAVPGRGASPPAAALFVTPAPVTILAGLGGNGSGWTLNGGSIVTNDVLTLTDGSRPEARSAFFNVPQYIAAFNAQFVYQCSGSADGAAFVLQNATGGARALGGYNSGLGYSGISPSAAVELNICSCTGGSGTLFATNGLTGYPPPSEYTSTLPVNLAGGHPIWVMLNYDGSNLAENLIDLITGESYNATYAVNLPVAVGGSATAFVGFTASDGDAGLASIQTISDFTFAPAPLLSAAVAGNQITITWAASSLNYVLQFTTNLAAPATWTPVPQNPVVTGVQATVTIPIGATNTFFRLLAP